MDFIERLDPELAAALQAFPAEGLADLNDIGAARTAAARMLEVFQAQAPAIEGVKTEDRLIQGPASYIDVPIRIYQPTDRPDLLPGLLWIHGGGYVLGNIEFDDAIVKQLAKNVECVVVSVDYRLAPEHTFPAPLEDCYAALRWMCARADEWGIDSSRIAVGGASAGGGLAAGLALLARDRAEVHVAFQLLIYPMIDDRNITLASQAITDVRVWNREKNLLGWKAYLGSEAGSNDVSPYAAAIRATDLSNLPPAYIPVGALDLFVDENIEYAQRLIQAGVPTELHIYPGTIHGFDRLAPSATITRRFIAEQNEVLKRALHRERISNNSSRLESKGS
jgi:acetyl esterase/lipase